MKLNKLLILTAITGLAFTSCENEMKQDPELDVVATGDGVNYDGQTITVQKGTPITFQLGGENDFLTFFSGEAGSKYEYKDRAQVATDQIESSKLTLDIKTEYGKLDMIDFKVLISKTFEGLNKSNFEADSILVEQHDGWQTLLSTADLPNPTSTKSYELDMLPYLGERVALAFVYKGVDNSQTQPKVYIQNLQIVNQMTDGTSSSLAASSLGFTPLNMMYKHNLSDQKSMTSNHHERHLEPVQHKQLLHPQLGRRISAEVQLADVQPLHGQRLHPRCRYAAEEHLAEPRQLYLHLHGGRYLHGNVCRNERQLRPAEANHTRIHRQGYGIKESL